MNFIFILFKFQIIVSFSNATYASAKLIVPFGTKNKYEASDDWSKFFNIVEEDMSGIKNTIFKEDNSQIWDLNGRIINDSKNDCYDLPHGIYIKNRKKILKK